MVSKNLFCCCCCFVYVFLFLFLFCFVLFCFFCFCFLFLSKSSQFCVVYPTRFCSNFTSMWYKHFFKEYMERLKTSTFFHSTVLATVEWKSFNGKFAAKIDFPIGYFMLLLYFGCWYWKCKVSPCIFYKYLEYMLVKFEQNRMVRILQNFWAFCQKMVNHFWQSVDATLEDVPVTETIVLC